MNRREALLAAGSGIAAVLSGCVRGEAGTEAATGTATGTKSPTATATSSPVPDCENASRPAPPAADAEPPGERERYQYPESPESLSEEATIRYVRNYERAYRLNDLYAEYGERLEHASVFVYGEWTYDAPAGTAIAQIEYAHSYGYEQGENQVEADAPYQYAAYAIDERGVWRAVVSGHRENAAELARDPYAGAPTECF